MVGGGAYLWGWALAAQGQAAEGMAQMRHGLAAQQAIGAELARPYFLALLAEGYGKQGQVEAGLAVLAEALALVHNSGERMYEAELYRLKGELLRQQAKGNRQRQQLKRRLKPVCVRRSSSPSRRRRKHWSCGPPGVSVTSGSSQGKQAEAYELLAPIYRLVH